MEGQVGSRGVKSEAVRSLVASVARDKNFATALDGARVLAEASEADYARARAAFETALGKKFKRGDLDRVVREERNKIARESSPGPRYVFTRGGAVWKRETKAGVEQVPLTNFTARIVAEVKEDDGDEVQQCLELKAELASQGRPESGLVTAAAFHSSRWWMNLLGPAAIVYPGMDQHARCAFQSLSGGWEVKRVYTHTGWREIEGRWFYLHRDGAIGEGLLPSVAVRLPASLSAFALPDPPTGAELRQAYAASLGLCQAGPLRVTAPLLGCVYSALLGPGAFSLYLLGDSGTGKSELAALAQSHFGRGFDAKSLAGWSSTANALEALAHTAKDAVLVVDDYAPPPTQQDAGRQQSCAERLLRAQGNQAGRLRMTADAALKAAKSPRGIIVSTGEDLPRGKSLRARLLVIEVSHSDVKWGRLTDCQRDAKNELYAAATAGFIRWLAPRLGEVRGREQRDLEGWRDRAGAWPGHKRTPDAVAHLARGWHYFLEAAVDAGALDQSAADGYAERVWEALRVVATQQAKFHETQDPARRFLDLLVEAVASGRAHLACPKGGEPEHPQAFGWRRDDRGELRPKGNLVGWAQGRDVFLLPEAAFEAAQQIGRGVGDALTVTPQTLRKRLSERDYLASTDQARETLTVRRRIDGAEHNVLHLRTEVFVGVSGGVEKPDKPDGTLPFQP